MRMSMGLGILVGVSTWLATPWVAMAWHRPLQEQQQEEAPAQADVVVPFPRVAPDGLLAARRPDPALTPTDVSSIDRAVSAR